MPPAVVTLIIVTWNRRRELEVALDSVFRQTIAADVEVIVVDNASSDDTVAWLTQEYPHPVRLLAFERNLGASAGRNAAIRVAAGEYVAFLDSDAEIESEDALERCVDYLRHHPVIRAVAGHIWFDREHTRVFAKGCYILSTGHFHGRRTRTDIHDPHFLSTCFSVWEKSLLVELRGFDPWYFWGIEDLDISLRAYHASRRGERLAASRYVILEGVDVLHEMSRGGRHYQPDDFHRAFHAIERQRLYLVMAYGGVGEMLRAAFRTPRKLKQVERDGWEQRLSWGKRLWALVLYPLLRIARAPLDRLGQRRDFLAEAPEPRELPRAAG